MSREGLFLRFRTSVFAAPLFCLVLGLPAGQVLAGEDPQPGQARTLEFLPSPSGSLTAWLVSDPLPERLARIAQVPAGEIREGGPAPAGTWQLLLSDSGSVDLRERARKTRSGAIWCAARIFSASGGERVLEGISYCAFKVFLNGQPVLQQAEPPGFEAAAEAARIQLPKGESQLAIVLGARYGYCEFALKLAASRSSAAVEGDRLRLPLAADSRLTAESALCASVAVQPGQVFLEPGQELSLTVGMRGGWPAGLGPFVPRLRAPGGKEIAGVLAERAPQEVPLRPWRVSCAIPEGEPALDFTCELVGAGKVWGSRRVRIYVLSAIERKAGSMKARLESARKAAARPFPYAALALEKIDLWLDRLAPTAQRLPWAGREPMRVRPTVEVGEKLLELLGEVEGMLQAEGEGRDPRRGQAGYFERAYQSAIDESPQPYFVVVPGAYGGGGAEAGAGKKFPLIVFLHGYVEDYHKHRWWVGEPSFNAHCDRNGCFAAIPFARSNADFLGPGEVDVLEVVREMKRLYPIDEERVYLYGYSMGGMGVYSLGGHYPDLWAAGVVLAGRADSPLLMGTRGLESLEPFKQFLIRTDQPIDLCENFGSLPLRIYHGRDDTIIAPREAERMAERLRASGCDVQLTLQPGDHWFGFEQMAEEEPVKWLLAQRRKANPPIRQVKNFIPRFGSSRAYYGQAHGGGVGPEAMGEGFLVSHLTGDLQPYEVAFGPRGGKSVFSRLEGSLADWYVGRGRPDRVEVPAEKAALFTPYEVPAREGREGEGFLHLGRAEWRVGSQATYFNPDWKSPIRCGPVKEATYGPFLVVYGTAGGAESTARLRSQAQGFADEWYAFAKGLVRVKADREVTAQEQVGRNLFLFGEEQENTLHGAAAATGRLPFQVKEGRVTLAGRGYALAQRGILYCYPNPLAGAAPWSLVVIAAGLRYGQQLPINHKLDLVPDFLLFGPEPDDDGTLTNKPLAAGFFDGRWQVRKDLTWWYGTPD